MKDRSPKAEGRRLNPEGQGGCQTHLSRTLLAGTRASCAKLLFGFRTSDFLRASAFGLRTLTAALGLLTPALPLPAASLISTNDIPPLRPPHAEIPPTFWEQYGLWVILCGVLVLGLVCVAAWFLTRPKPPVIVPPEVQARQALEPLRQQPEDGALLSRLSQILRRYVIAAFDLPPGELTTTEFCRAIAGHDPVGPDLSATLSEFFRQCDQRKFAPPPAPAPPFGAVARPST